MSSIHKCKSCGSLEIDVSQSRGDAVCTLCGLVLEVIIVAEVQFQEGANGTSNAIGQFVSAESKGGATKFGASFHVGIGVESREITLRKAKSGITNLCNQLQLNQCSIDTACSFFKMALSRNLTKGRRNTHIYGACVYLTCRTEGSAHLLIDISDAIQVCCYELGRTYLKLSQALCLNIPAVDPCMYIMRFAAKLEFGNKTSQVSNTAMRLVQRMKRDSIHSGRRPSGLCGAALLIAARLHDFGRSTSDIVKIVKVHESTLRKRLIEFGDTPSSALTLEEFMTVDLEEEQDPPSFKTARKKDKERLQRLMEEEAESITELQQEIEMQLNREPKSKASRKKLDTYAQEMQEANRFIHESTLGTINQIINNEGISNGASIDEPVIGLGPDIASMGLANSLDDTSNAIGVQPAVPLEVDLTFDDIDDEELNAYIMTENEFECKKGLWMKRNAAYLEEQKIKEEKLQKEREEGKPEKKRRRHVKRKPVGPTSSAGEAIEKILQEKKVSSKINYEVLKSLNATFAQNEPTTITTTTMTTNDESLAIKKTLVNSSESNPTIINPTVKKYKKTKIKSVGLPVVSPTKTEEVPMEKDEPPIASEEEMDEFSEDEDEHRNEPNENGLLEMLRQHRNEDGDEHDEYYGYDDDEY